MECPECGNPIYGEVTDGGDSGMEPIMVRYRCSRCGTEAREPEPYENDDQPDQDAIEARIIELFAQLPREQQSSLLDELIGFIEPAEEVEGDTHPFHTLTHLAEIDDGLGYSQHARDPMFGGLSADD